MSSVTRGLLVAACLLSVCPAAFAKAKPQAGFDPAGTAALSGVPVEIVLLNDRLRAQYTYQSTSVDPSIAQQAVVNAMGPAAYSGAGIAAGAIGGALASALINAEMEMQARRLVEPAAESLRLAQCEIDVGTELTDAIEVGVKATSWGTGASVARYRLAGKQTRLGDVIAENRARYVLAASYSLTPDFSAVVTTVNAAAYLPAGEDGPRNWQKKPLWSDQLAVVSDRLHPPARTPADIEREVARENARYKASDANRLIKEANAGDSMARTQAVRLMDEHKRALRRANEVEWVPAAAAERRAELWSQDGCAALKSALADNHRVIGAMMAQLFAGELDDMRLPTEPAYGFVAPNTPIPVTTAPVAPAADPGIGPMEERKVFAAPGNLFISRRVNDGLSLDYRFAWLPLPKDKAKD